MVILKQTKLALCDSSSEKKLLIYMAIALWIYRLCRNGVIAYKSD